MALITVFGEPGCRHHEVARLAAHRLGFELVTEPGLETLIQDEFGATPVITDKVWPQAAASVLARLATQHHLVIHAPGCEFLFRNFPGILRVYVTAPEGRRIGNLMVDRRLDRAGAKKLLRELAAKEREARKRRYGRATFSPDRFDLVFGGETLDSEHQSGLVEAGALASGIIEFGLFSEAAEAQHQFQVRLQLAKHGIHPSGRVSLKRSQFGHPSEQIFANLLDFYRIAWQHEPRSFPIQWDKDGKPLESFTPDFYLPEFDLYVELTTMKQSLVTRKNRKIKLLRTIYPHINIRVFYQKDFQDLVMKHGIAERVSTV
jgi:hypothetical protein